MLKGGYWRTLRGLGEQEARIGNAGDYKPQALNSETTGSGKTSRSEICLQVIFGPKSYSAALSAH